MKAYENMQKQGDKMKRRAYMNDGHDRVIPHGTVVQFGVHEVDRAKTDPSNITAIVVEQVSLCSTTEPNGTPSVMKASCPRSEQHFFFGSM